MEQPFPVEFRVLVSDDWRAAKGALGCGFQMFPPNGEVNGEDDPRVLLSLYQGRTILMEMYLPLDVARAVGALCQKQGDSLEKRGRKTRRRVVR